MESVQKIIVKIKFFDNQPLQFNSKNCTLKFQSWKGQLFRRSHSGFRDLFNHVLKMLARSSSIDSSQE